MNNNALNRRAENEAIAWLAKLESSKLTVEQEQAFMRWLEMSPRHQAAYIKVEELWQRGEVLNRLPENRMNFIWMTRWLTIPATCAILLVGIFLYSHMSSTLSESYDIQTARGEFKRISLLDGSDIALNTHSQLSVAVTNNRREVFLEKGEAFFDVNRDPNRPFIINSHFGSVRVLGTQFSVRVLENDIEVTVLGGKVEIGHYNQNNHQFHAQAVVIKDQQLSMSDAEEGVLPDEVNAHQLLSWRDKKLIYERARLDTVIEDLRRYYPQTVLLANSEMAEMEITAVIQIAEFETTVKVLAHSLAITPIFSDDGTQVTLQAGD